MKNDIEILEQEVKNILSKLLECIKSDDNLVRADSIEILKQFFTTEIQDALLLSLNDKDELVQVTAIEALVVIKNKDYIPNIRCKLNSKSWLVRAYAAEALGDFLDIDSKSHLIKKLKSAYEEELPRIYYALIKFGEMEYLTLLYECLNDENYRVRIATSNLLYYLVDKENINFIIKKLNSRLLIEKERSVISTIKDTLSSLESFSFSSSNC